MEGRLGRQLGQKIGQLGRRNDRSITKKFEFLILALADNLHHTSLPCECFAETD